jgi:putative hydrolase
VRAATPVDWSEASPGILGELIDPVAAKVSRAMGEQTDALGGQETGMIAQALGQMAPMFMGIQAGTILGGLAREVTGVGDTGLPVTEETMLLVLPTIDEVAREYGLDRRLVRQWVALRAAAHRMASEGLTFVRTHFFSLFHNYVASLDFDFGEGLRRLEGLDLTDPARLQEALGDEGLFTHQTSAETERAAARIAGFLAIVEAHTDAAAEAAGARAGDLGPVIEAFRRRSADEAGGSRRLAQFIGLDTTGDRRRAETFVSAVLKAGGWTALNRMWDMPEALPTDAEISDPEGWLRRIGA